MTFTAVRKFQCLNCGAEFEEPYGKPRWVIKCPKCGSSNIIRIDREKRDFGGWGRCRGREFTGKGGRGRRWRWGWRWGRGFEEEV